MHQLMWTPYWILAFWALWLYVTEGLCSHGCMSVYPFRSNVLYHASRRICQLDIFNHLSVKWSCDCDCLMLIVCVAAPTESPGDEQRGVQGLAQLEAGELEEIQRTFLKVWNRGMSWRHQRKHTGGCFIFFCPFGRNRGTGAASTWVKTNGKLRMDEGSNEGVEDVMSEWGVCAVCVCLG